MKTDQGFHVLGIDPGTRCIGWGLIHVIEKAFRSVDHGFYQVNNKLSFPDKLHRIHTFISDLLNRLHPEVVAVEEVYVSQNAKTTLRLGHARGVILLAAVEHGVEIFEYAPREIKQAVFGRGSATKDQVQWMLFRLLDIPQQELQEDEADGLAVALCHGLRSSTASIYSQ
jgi:crossover junction endodeoxyribonuclease RuvC